MARKKAVRKTTTKSTASRRNLTGEQIARLNEIVKEQAGVIAQQRELLKAAQHAAQAEHEADTVSHGSYVGAEPSVCRNTVTDRQLGFKSKESIFTDHAMKNVINAAPTPAKLSPIEMSIDGLYMQINLLHSSFTLLYDGLAGQVLAPVPPTTDDKVAATKPTTCKLEASIEDVASQMASLRNWIDQTKLRLML
jgi:hypothetical protein